MSLIPKATEAKHELEQLPEGAVFGPPVARLFLLSELWRDDDRDWKDVRGCLVFVVGSIELLTPLQNRVTFPRLHSCMSGLH